MEMLCGQIIGTWSHWDIYISKPDVIQFFEQGAVLWVIVQEGTKSTQMAIKVSWKGRVLYCEIEDDLYTDGSRIFAKMLQEFLKRDT